MLFKFSAFLKRIMQHSAHLLVKLRAAICYLGPSPSTNDAFLVLCYNKKEPDRITTLPGETKRNEQPDARGRRRRGRRGAVRAVDHAARPAAQPRGDDSRLRTGRSPVRSPGWHQAAGDQTQRPRQSTWRATPPSTAPEHRPRAPPPSSAAQMPPPPVRPVTCASVWLLHSTAEDVGSETRFRRVAGRGPRGRWWSCLRRLCVENVHESRLPPAAV